MVFYGLSFHTYKVYLINFMNLCLEEYAEKKIQNVFKFHPPSQGFFLPPVREVVQGFYFFVSISYLFFFSQKLLKMHLKKPYDKNAKIICENLFTIK